jgi:hypothetical protein
MQPAEISFWLDQADRDQMLRVKTAAQLAQEYWLAQRLHPLDVLTAIDAAVSVEIIAMRGLRVIGRA